MLGTIASAWIFLELKGSLSRVWTTLEDKFWTEWEIRVMVLISLLMQFALIKLGKQRKHVSKPGTGISVWLVYLLADWLATVSLSTLLKSKEDLNPKQGQTRSMDDIKEGRLEDGLIVFWTPFLLLHLGGPDSITAYSLADNELWLRHLLGLLIQVGTAFYVYYRFHSNSLFQYLAIPVFIAGIIKYGERIWVLRSASTKQFLSSVFSASKSKARADPGGKKQVKPENMEDYLRSKIQIPETIICLHEAFLSFKLFIPLFSDLTLRIYDNLRGIFINVGNKSVEEAFSLAENELGFLYDVLYTKRTLLHSKVGAILRFICVLCCLSTLVAFLFVRSRVSCLPFDTFICYSLLFGAILMDLYSIITHVVSRWTLLLTSRNNSKLAKLASHAIASRLISRVDEAGCQTIAEHNLIDFCVKFRGSKIISLVKLLDTDSILLKYRFTNWKPVDLHLKEFIYSHLLEKHKRYKEDDYEFKTLLKLLDERGGKILQSRDITEDFKWSIDEVEFNHSLLLWHIATDLCYYDDHKKDGDIDLLGPSCQISKSLSDYMMYLLVVRPFMLPQGISAVRIRDTCKKAMSFFPRKQKLTSDTARTGLLERNADLPTFLSQEEDKSALFDGCKLAQQLQTLVSEYGWDNEEKWKMISEVWVEMLTFAAGCCEWKAHVHQLRHGKELLTQVSLLMLHLGLSSRMRIVKVKDEELGLPSWDWETLTHLSRCLA